LPGFAENAFEGALAGSYTETFAIAATDWTSQEVSPAPDACAIKDMHCWRTNQLVGGGKAERDIPAILARFITVQS
jgi:hypothetical protein